VLSEGKQMEKAYLRERWETGGKGKKLGPCPHPEKHAYGNRLDAERNMYAMWRKGRGTRLVCRVYPCRCGNWHTTKKAYGNTERGEE
jgi:hypothetical protein